MELGQDEEIRARAEPPLGPPDEIGHRLGAGSGALRPGRVTPQHEQELGLAARLDPRERDFRRRVADVDPCDEH
jgi:hypothetical protein